MSEAGADRATVMAMAHASHATPEGARADAATNILRVKTHSNPLMVKTYFSITSTSGNRL